MSSFFKERNFIYIYSIIPQNIMRIQFLLWCLLILPWWLVTCQSRVWLCSRREEREQDKYQARLIKIYNSCPKFPENDGKELEIFCKYCNNNYNIN